MTNLEKHLEKHFGRAYGLNLNEAEWQLVLTDLEIDRQYRILRKNYKKYGISLKNLEKKENLNLQQIKNNIIKIELEQFTTDSLEWSLKRPRKVSNIIDKDIILEILNERKLILRKQKLLNVEKHLVN